MSTLTTPRLLLRQWRESDREPWAAMSADPEVMRFYPAPLTRAQADAFADWAAAHIAEHGWGLWAVEVRGGAPFVGYVGLNRPTFEAAFTPAIEIGWRLARSAWGQGYATEAANAVLAHAFTELAFDEVVSFTSVVNAASRRVMERIGLHHDRRDDFDHPRLAPGHALGRHALYRLTREQWQAQQLASP